jgi:hypothetical protein
MRFWNNLPRVLNIKRLERKIVFWRKKKGPKQDNQNQLVTYAGERRNVFKRDHYESYVSVLKN